MQCSTHNGRKYFTAHSCHWDVETAFLYLVNQSKKQPCYTSRQWPKWCILQHRTVWAICYFMDFNVDFRVCFAQPPHPLPKHPHKYRLLQIKSPRLGHLELKQNLVSMLDIPQGFGDCHRHTVKSKFNHKGYFCQTSLRRGSVSSYSKLYSGSPYELLPSSSGEKADSGR